MEDSNPVYKKILIAFSDEMIKDVEDYWHDKKLASRTEAFRELIKKGSETDES